MWREQAIIEWSWHVNSIVACCHSAKLCAYAARDFRSQQNGAVTRMWRSCGVQPSHKERAIRCKKEGMLLQPLRWCCVDCVINHERDVREEQHRTYMWREQGIIEWSWHVNSIVACCHSAKLCAYAARDFRSQHSFIPPFSSGILGLFLLLLRNWKTMKDNAFDNCGYFVRNNIKDKIGIDYSEAQIYGAFARQITHTFTKTIQ